MVDEALTALRPQKVIHFAAEAQLTPKIKSRVSMYETADLDRPGVDHQVDLTNLPFPDASYDLLIASHVLEHIMDDRAALSEIRRVLRPGGAAIIPVPTHDGPTVEYGAPDPTEAGHVRRPGLDYYDRYAEYFRVELRSSEDYPAAYHLQSHLMSGGRSSTYAPICYV